MSYEVEEDVHDPSDEVVVALIGLGSNLGDRKSYLSQALAWLRERRGVRVVATSSVYETRPEGGPSQGDYLNAVVRCETNLSPHALLALLHMAEDMLGRVREERDGPRVIDLDLLLHGEAQIVDPELSLPHPRFHLRAFALIPAAEVAPEIVFPGRERTLAQMAEALGPPSGTVRRRRTGIWERWR